MAISARPRAGGSRPAPSPTQAAASIWKGSHGPTPPVMRADAARESAPSEKPKPGPSARPPRTRMNQMGSSPAVPAPSGRRTHTTAVSTPSIAIDFASMPPSASCASTTMSTRGTTAAKIHGASAAWATAVEPGSARKGQAKAATPTRDAIVTAIHDRGPMRTARAGRGASHAATASCRSWRGATRHGVTVIRPPPGPRARPPR